MSADSLEGSARPRLRTNLRPHASSLPLFMGQQLHLEPAYCSCPDLVNFLVRDGQRWLPFVSAVTKSMITNFHVTMCRAEMPGGGGFPFNRPRHMNDCELGHTKPSLVMRAPRGWQRPASHCDTRECERMFHGWRRTCDTRKGRLLPQA